MTDQTKTRIPAPLYAAAGAGELAYEKLRQLPAVVTELRGRAAETSLELRERATARFKAANDKAVDLQKKAAADFDVDKLREVALRNRDALVAGAHKAQERASAVYEQLVARGERVVGSGAAAGADVVKADIEVTGASAPQPNGAPKQVAVAAGPSPVKTARPAKRTTRTVQK